MGLRIYGQYDRRAASDAASVSEFSPSRTIQSQRDEADINNIVRNFGVTGRLPQGVRVPQYGDFTVVDDYQTALEALKAASDSFAAMSAETRRRFDNDPQKFLEFCEDERNLDEMRKLGLAVPESASSTSEASS